MSAPARPSNTAEAQRKRRACANYGQNAAGKWVRKTAWRACDYIDGGQLRQFDTEEAFLTFEEERRAQGHSQAHYEKLPRGTVPKEQLALEEAITNAVAKDGNETRVHLQSVVEGLHQRHDEQQATLCEIRAHQLQQDKQQSAILEKKAALADKQKAKNEAFASRVEAGDGTPLEEKKLRIKILTEEVRREEAELKLKKQREKARQQGMKRARAAAADGVSTSEASGSAAGGAEVAPGPGARATMPPRAHVQAALPACSRRKRRREAPVHEAQPEVPVTQPKRCPLERHDDELPGDDPRGDGVTPTSAGAAAASIAGDPCADPTRELGDGERSRGAEGCQPDASTAAGGDSHSGEGSETPSPAAPRSTRDELVQQIRAGHRPGALAPQEAQALLGWAQARLSDGEPYVVTMAGRPQPLHHLKLMYGIADEASLLPIYNFGLTKIGWKRAAPMPELPQRRAEQIRRAQQLLHQRARDRR